MPESKAKEIVATLSPLDRDALAVLALFVHPLSRSAWEAEVRKTGLRESPSRGLYGEAFKAVIARLVAVDAFAFSRFEAYQVADSLVAPALDDARRRGTLGGLMDAIAPRDVPYYGWSHGVTQRVRLAVVRGDRVQIAEAFHRVVAYRPRRPVNDARGELLEALTTFASPAWLASLPAEARDEYLRAAFHRASTELVPVAPWLVDEATSSLNPEVRGRAAVMSALRGDTSRAMALVVSDDGSPWTLGARGFVALTEGRWADALDAFDRARTTKHGALRARGLPSYLAVFELLLGASPVGPAVLASTLPSRVEAGVSTLAPWPGALRALLRLATFRASGRRAECDSMAGFVVSWIDALTEALTGRWMGDKRSPGEDVILRRFEKAADQAGYAWPARQLRAVAIDGARDGEALLVELATDTPPWKLALEALAGISAAPRVAARDAVVEGEVLWGVDVSGSDARLFPRLVKRAGQVGSALSAERLQTDTSLPLAAEDRPLVDALVASKRLRQVGVVPLRTLLRAVGHPRLRDAFGAPLVLVRGAIEVHVSANASGAHIEVLPSSFPDGVALTREPGRMVLTEPTEVGARLISVLGEKGLRVPREGLANVVETLAALSDRVTIRGTDALVGPDDAAREPADGRLHVQLFRAGTRFRVRLRVAPAGSDGPSVRPGAEPKHVLVASGRGTRALARDLDEERALVARVLIACPTLDGLPIEGEERVASELETCLELLLELGALPREDVIIAWPEGEPLRAPVVRSDAAMRIRVKGDASWLTVEAELAVDEARVLSLRELIEGLSTARGRFVALGDGAYLALTDKLRAKIESLARVQNLGDARGRVPAVMLPALEQWSEGAELSMADAMRDRLTVLRQALAATPRVPRGLQAELRDYQREGFVFLARRASAGLGTCLADDMGLGKTVQALALLLARATNGPALVLAPTSVCRNWHNEARKFAPSLRVHVLGDVADRGACIDALGANDVVLVTYGLLVPCAEALALKRFATVVFDEAHALKNPQTQRATSARALSADAFVALTGTPVENHLGELHALFQLLAPGLLGPRERFERVLGGPIAQGDKHAAAHLRTLVRPFLLRRTKAQVLDELPAKTEITRLVSPSTDERAFYEALRRRALERVEEATAKAGNRARIDVLAEITKLRRAAIDPRLVGGNDAPAGTKLEVLAELVRELREEGHRALVFSQFLEVLDRAGERLTEDGAVCVRLDGTMNATARAAAVDAFQSERADVFLLSLRAGGVGMNLTAADYVIHLDPWWNPAVEDQATDRAHRIGQLRPVTVVRLVTEGTIEEKVLRLHASKRALYTDAIGEIEGARKIDVDALASLLLDGATIPARPSAKGARAKQTPSKSETFE